MTFRLNWLLLPLFLTWSLAQEIEKPHMLVIMCNDLGWNDVSFHGSDQILTPNLDTMAFHGVMLHQHYTDGYETPSKSAFLTGKYPSKLGIQSGDIGAAEDRGLPVQEKLLPVYLNKLGYETHYVGTWGLGQSRNHYLPNNRGYNSFYGSHHSSVDYYTHQTIEIHNNKHYYGLDLYNNTEIVEDSTGHYTDIVTRETIRIIKDHDNSKRLFVHVSHPVAHIGGGLVNLQPKPEYLEKNAYIAHSARRYYASMVTHLDNSIGEITAALAEKGLLENTLIVFIAQNGAPTIGPKQNFGVNLPLRGIQGTPWEGGVRSTALLWHSELASDIWDGLFHITDWCPTLIAAAGGTIEEPIDGINQWDALINNEPSKRTQAIVAIDDVNKWATIREGDLKFIVGNMGRDISGYIGSDLVNVLRPPPPYERVLEECMTSKVFREVLNRELDIESVYMKRNDSILYQSDEAKLLDSELCVPTLYKGCLFNIKDDPFERRDLWDVLPDAVKHLTLILRLEWVKMVPRGTTVPDERAHPNLHNNAWGPWLDNAEPKSEVPATVPDFPLQVTKMELEHLVDMNIESFKEKVVKYIENLGMSFVKSCSGLFNF